MNITHLNIGDAIEPSDWFEVTQALVKQFADVSGDHQWIHLDSVLKSIQINTLF